MSPSCIRTGRFLKGRFLCFPVHQTWDSIDQGPSEARYWIRESNTETRQSLLTTQSTEITIIIKIKERQPAQHWEDMVAIWFAEPAPFCPTPLTAVFEQATCSPFMSTVVAVSPELPIISLSSGKNQRITRDAVQACWDFTLSVGCKCPYNAGFFNLVLLLPAAAIQSAENKSTKAFKACTMTLSICQRLDKQCCRVSALLETFMLWESGCMRPPVRAVQGRERAPMNSSAISGTLTWMHVYAGLGVQLWHSMGRLRDINTGLAGQLDLSAGLLGGMKRSTPPFMNVHSHVYVLPIPMILPQIWWYFVHFKGEKLPNPWVQESCYLTKISAIL